MNRNWDFFSLSLSISMCLYVVYDRHIQCVTHANFRKPLLNYCHVENVDKFIFCRSLFCHHCLIQIASFVYYFQYQAGRQALDFFADHNIIFYIFFFVFISLFHFHLSCSKFICWLLLLPRIQFIFFFSFCLFVCSDIFIQLHVSFAWVFDSWIPNIRVTQWHTNWYVDYDYDGISYNMQK